MVAYQWKMIIKVESIDINVSKLFFSWTVHQEPQDHPISLPAEENQLMASSDSPGPTPMRSTVCGERSWHQFDEVIRDTYGFRNSGGLSKFNFTGNKINQRKQIFLRNQRSQEAYSGPYLRLSDSWSWTGSFNFNQGSWMYNLVFSVKSSTSPFFRNSHGSDPCAYSPAHLSIKTLLISVLNRVS